MRVTRFLLMLLTIAVAVAGCALQPAPMIPVVAAPVAPAVAPGVDSTVYGSLRPRTPPPGMVVAGRGLMTGAVVADPPRAAVAPPIAEAYAPTVGARPYTLDSGDRLRIVVFGQDGLSNSYLVDASGYIAMPLIGSVLARGRTTEQLSSAIAERLRRGFVREPQVAVEIEAYRPFFILGEVAQPGQYPYVADMTVETAVAIAGGFSPRAFRRTVTITRIVHGHQVRLKVPLTYPLRPGDTINVQERWF